jgi:hypothetical protein
MQVSALAGEALSFFERAHRESGPDYIRTRDEPEWVHELVRRAHGNMFPDDWRYEAIRDALSAIEDSGAESIDDLDDVDHEYADGKVDIYTGDRIAWLASHGLRADYCDEARSEGIASESASVVELIGAGQYMEAQEVFSSVVQSLRDRLEELDEDEDEAESA